MMMILSTTAHSFFATSVILLTVLVSLSSAHLQDEELFHYGGGTSTTTEGVTFTREINKLPGSFDLHFDNNNRCDSQDVHGDNDCHFDWNEDVTGAYKLVIDVPIEEGDQMEGHFKIDHFIPYSFTCPLCGKDCVLTFPVVKFNYTIPLPPCPIPAPHTVATKVEYQLNPSSPTGGLPTRLEGTVKITKATTGEEVADFTVRVLLN